MDDLTCIEILRGADVENRGMSAVNKLMKENHEFSNYLENRFLDSSSIKETVYRIINNIETKPKCRCGNEVSFQIGQNKFNKYCSAKCQNSDPEKIAKDKQSKFIKYGNENYNNMEKNRITCLERYGVTSFLKTTSFVEKVQKTNIEKYGSPWIMQTEYFKDKAKDVKRNKYGDENYNNRELAKKTSIEKYGVPNTKQWEGAKQKEKETCLKKYGVTSYSKTSECQEKKRKTFMERWGVDNCTKSDEWKKKWYGNTEWVEARNEKIYQSMAKNGSFNNSKEEKTLLDFLSKWYPDVIYQYKDERYPFKCDFYIPSKDLFIEYNGFWFHRDHYYDETNPEDLKIVNEWKSKKTKFYDNAINTWTVRDVEKIKKVKENHLNFIALWHKDVENLEEIKLMVDTF